MHIAPQIVNQISVEPIYDEENVLSNVSAQWREVVNNNHTLKKLAMNLSIPQVHAYCTYQLNYRLALMNSNGNTVKERVVSSNVCSDGVCNATLTSVNTTNMELYRVGVSVIGATGFTTSFSSLINGIHWHSLCSYSVHHP